MSQTATRQTAEERRAAVLDAARVEFARHGLHGASTDAIARSAGISQPYLFRLFGSKKALFIAVNAQCFQRTLELFRSAAAGTSGQDALDAIAAAYGELIESDRTMLQGQLQAYAASVFDDDVRESTARGYGRLVDYVETVSDADRRTVASFFAKGMLMNVLSAMDYSIADEPKDSWAARLADGFRSDEP
jgi:AcrR family transcriptional regulator